MEAQDLHELIATNYFAATPSRRRFYSPPFHLADVLSRRRFTSPPPQYTGVKGGLPLRTACTFATAIAAMRRRVSAVALPMCGNNTVRGAASRRGWIAGSSV